MSLDSRISSFCLPLITCFKSTGISLRSVSLDDWRTMMVLPRDATDVVPSAMAIACITVIRDFASCTVNAPGRRTAPTTKTTGAVDTVMTSPARTVTFEPGSLEEINVVKLIERIDSLLDPPGLLVASLDLLPVLGGLLQCT